MRAWRSPTRRRRAPCAALWASCWVHLGRSRRTLLSCRTLAMGGACGAAKWWVFASTSPKPYTLRLCARAGGRAGARAGRRDDGRGGQAGGACAGRRAAGARAHGAQARACSPAATSLVATRLPRAQSTDHEAAPWTCLQVSPLERPRQSSSGARRVARGCCMAMRGVTRRHQPSPARSQGSAVCAQGGQGGAVWRHRPVAAAAVRGLADAVRRVPPLVHQPHVLHLRAGAHI